MANLSGASNGLNHTGQDDDGVAGKSILILINEKAGSISGPTVAKTIQEELARFPVTVRDEVAIVSPGKVETLRALIQQHQTTLKRVIAAGGDGTITDTISAIIPFPHIQLGILPLGTGNRLASNLGIPPHLRGALDVALNGVPHPLDVGRINDRYFSLMAGAGLDADIMDKVQPAEKRLMGLLAYFWRGVQGFFRVSSAVFEIEADGLQLRCRGIGVVVANAGNLLGPFFTLTPGARTDDGLFDLCVLGGRSRRDYIPLVAQVLLQQRRSIFHRRGVRHLRAKRITIKSRPALKTQADGDVIGYTPIEIEALPAAIRVMVPAEGQVAVPLTDSIRHFSEQLRLTIRDLLKI